MTTSIDELKGVHMMTDTYKPRFVDCSGEAYVGYPLFDWIFRWRPDSERSHAIWKANYAAFTPVRHRLLRQCGGEGNSNLRAPVNR